MRCHYYESCVKHRTFGKIFFIKRGFKKCPFQLLGFYKEHEENKSKILQERSSMQQVDYHRHRPTPWIQESVSMHRAGQYLNTLYLNTVFKYIYCIYTLYLNTFFNLYLITVFKYMYLNTFLNTFLHTPLNINNRSSVDWSANHGRVQTLQRSHMLHLFTPK